MSIVSFTCDKNYFYILAYYLLEIGLAFIDNFLIKIGHEKDVETKEGMNLNFIKVILLIFADLLLIPFVIYTKCSIKKSPVKRNDSKNEIELIYNNPISNKRKKKIFTLSNTVYILFFLSYFLYYLSLERCMQGIFECGKKIKWINRKLTQAVLSSVIICILLELMILRIITKLHLIHVLIIQYIFYTYSHGQDFYDHGLYNFLGYIIIVFIIMILLFPYNIIIYLNKNKKQKALFLYLPFIIFFFFFYNFVINPNLSCKEWSKGLNDTYIDNDNKKYGCQIRIPKLCLYKIGTYFLDISKINKCSFIFGGCSRGCFLWY